VSLQFTIETPGAPQKPMMGVGVGVGVGAIVVVVVGGDVVLVE
jgi:hypothetical protein